MNFIRYLNTFILEPLTKIKRRVSKAEIYNFGIRLELLPAQTESLDVSMVIVLAESFLFEFIELKTWFGRLSNTFEPINPLRHINFNLSRTYLVVEISSHIWVS